MRLTRYVAAAAVVTMAVAGCGSSKKSTSTPTNASGNSNPSIAIGAANFTENDVLAYVYSDALKAAGISSSVKPDIGSREILQPALQHNDFQATIEYLGNYLAYLNPKVGNLSIAATEAALRPLAAAKGLTIGTYSNAADSDAVAVTQSTATKDHLVSIADLAPYASKWYFGGPAECATRVTCYLGLTQYYGLHFKGFKTLDDDGVITHTALANGNVQAARIFSSDAVIAQDHFVVLTDPKDFQGAGNLVPVIRTGDATAAVVAVFDKVSAALTTADLVQFNLAVSANHQDPSSVASQFVSSHNL